MADAKIARARVEAENRIVGGVERLLAAEAIPKSSSRKKPRAIR